MGAGISVIKRCAKMLTNNSVRQVTQALILSNIDYCPSVWSSASKNKIKQVQIVQNRAARVVLQCDIRTNVLAMHDRLNWLSVRNRLRFSLLVFARNILVTKNPSILFNRFLLISDQHSYATRQATCGNFTLPKTKRTAMEKTMVHRAITEWNGLPNYIIQENNKSTFKRLLKQYLLSQNREEWS